MASGSTHRIVSSRLDDPQGHTYDRYVATGGYQGLRRALAALSPEQVVAEVKESGLTGRSGGQAFPTAAKWELLGEGEPRFVVVNGDESEPGFFKDRALMEADPHQLIEGALLCAYAIGAPIVFVYVRGEMSRAQERVTRAVDEAYEQGMAGADILGSGYSCDLVVHPGAGAYVVGEETALIESLEGKRGFPRIKPPYYPAVSGLYSRPTIVNNVETLSTLPWIVRHGGGAYAALGGGRFAGTRLFCLSGRTGPFPHPPRLGAEPTVVPFPYKQTTICPLGPSAVSPVESSVWRFRDDYLHHIKEDGCPYRRG
jgi:NADH-quinone oxidoreductase subunit F